MNEFKSNKIQGIIDEINKTQAMIELHTCHKDTVSAFMAKQYNGIKRKLFKELLAELMLADLSFRAFHPAAVGVPKAIGRGGCAAQRIEDEFEAGGGVDGGVIKINC